MMSIRPLIAFVLFVCLLMACQASPVPAPSPTAVAVAVATSPTAVAQPTLAPTVTAEPPSTPEPAATATISLTAEITTTTLMTGTEVISGTIEINEQQFTLDQIKAFATDSGLTAEEVARITSIEAAEGNQILALDTSGAVVAKFTVNAEGELGVEESFSASDTIMEQLGAGIPNNLGKIYHSDEHNITIYAQNPFSSTHSIESNSPVLPENYINALGQIRANLANGFRAVDIITGEITLWTTEKLVAAGIDTSETQIIAVSTADIPLPTLTLRSSGENFHLGSLSQTREAMFADIRNQVNGQTGQKWRTQVNAYFSPTENIYFLVENTKSLTTNNEGIPSGLSTLEYLLEEASPGSIPGRAFVYLLAFSSSEVVENLLESQTSPTTLIGEVDEALQFIVSKASFPELEIDISPLNDSDIEENEN